MSDVAGQEALVEVSEALTHAKDTFYRYAKLHRAKGTEDGDKKACTNAGMGEEMDRALTALQTLTALAHEAAPLLAISTSYGHGPARDGLRCAGFYYKADDAARERVLPAHCLSAIRDLIAALTKEGKSA